LLNIKYMSQPIKPRQTQAKNFYYNFRTHEMNPATRGRPYLYQGGGKESILLKAPESKKSSVLSESDVAMIKKYAEDVDKGVYGKNVATVYKNMVDKYESSVSTQNPYGELNAIKTLLRDVRNADERDSVEGLDRVVPRNYPQWINKEPEPQRKKTIAEVDRELADVIKKSQQTGDEYAQVVEESKRMFNSAHTFGGSAQGGSLDQLPPPTSLSQPVPRPSRTTPFGETPYIDMETTPRKKLDSTPQPSVPEPYDSEVPQDLQNLESKNREQASGIIVNKATEEDLKYRERQSSANVLHRFMNEAQVLGSSSNSAFSGGDDIYSYRDIQDLQNSNQYAKAPAQERTPYRPDMFNERTGAGMSRAPPRDFASGSETPVDPNYYRNLVMGGANPKPDYNNPKYYDHLAEKEKEKVIPRPTVTRGRLSDYVRLTPEERDARFGKQALPVAPEIGESRRDPSFSYWGRGMSRAPEGMGRQKSSEEVLADRRANIRGDMSDRPRVQDPMAEQRERSRNMGNIYPQLEGVSLPNYSDYTNLENKPVRSQASLLDNAQRLGDFVSRGSATLRTIGNAQEGGGEGGGIFQQIAHGLNLTADRNEEKKQDGLYGAEGNPYNADVSNARTLQQRFDMSGNKVKGKFGKVNKYVNMKDKSMLASQLLGVGVSAPNLKDLRSNIVQYNQPTSSLKGNAVNLIRRGNATALTLNNEYMP
jgi:hypothetical protein